MKQNCKVNSPCFYALERLPCFAALQECSPWAFLLIWAVNQEEMCTSVPWEVGWSTEEEYIMAWPKVCCWDGTFLLCKVQCLVGQLLLLPVRKKISPTFHVWKIWTHSCCSENIVSHQLKQLLEDKRELLYWNWSSTIVSHLWDRNNLKYSRS